MLLEDEINISKNFSSVDKNYVFYSNHTNEIIKIESNNNQKNILANNSIKTVDLDDCENKLKEYYNIPENASLIILKFEKIEEGTNISKTQYEVHYPLNGSFIQLMKFN